MVSAAVALPESLLIPERSQTSGASPIETYTVISRPEVREDRVGPTVHRQVALIQLRGLIAAFQEVQDYNPRRHHNQPQPALWVDDKQYLLDVKALVHELRRLNDILESGTAIPAKVEKSGSLVASLAEKVCHSAADVTGKGLATYYDARGDVLELLNTKVGSAGFVELSQALTPSFDFGKAPATPMDQAIELARQIVGAKGSDAKKP